MRRILVTGILVSSFLAINAYAGEPGFLGPNGNGVYFGTAVGYHQTRTNMTVSSGASSDLLNDGAIGGLYLGYAIGFSQRFILSIEMDANLFSYKDLSKTVATQTVSKAALENNYGVSIMPGIAIGARSQLYLKTGFENALLRVATHSAGSSFSLSTRIWGYDLGGGYAIRVAKKVSLRVEYLHVWYYKESQAFSAIGVTNTFKATDSRVMAGIAYHFIV